MRDPIFIVAAPRSGSALLVETLRQSNVIDGADRIDALIAARCGPLDRLTAAEATPEVAASLRDAVAALSGEGRIIDASPRNLSRVPFLHAVFPNSTFVYIYREPRRTVYDLGAVSDLSPRTIARQWTDSTSMLLDDLERLPPGRWVVVAYYDLMEDPATAIAQVARFLGIAWNGSLPPRPRTLDPPEPRVLAELDVVDDITRAVAERAREIFATPPPRAAPAREPFHSVSTQSFPTLLQRLGVSIVVSTYQSGRLIFLRAENATTLNTHFRMFHSPMGIAVGRGRITIGTEREVWDYRNMPAVAEKLEPPGRHDACFVPRKIHVTGDIRIHEIGYAADELWIVNTRFSALCTLDAESTFVPRWHPSFITQLAPEDRCHLNGMAIVEDRVRYVTALGATDTAGGWRANKATGGLLIDVQSGETVLRGLSMPHSPRHYNGRFFILESGKGTLATADLSSGRVETIAELPGFTRGLAFAGPFAFVGLSQVRESNVFGGIPLTERVAERQCGVFVIDLRSGQTVAFLRFEGDVREIFDVQVLHGLHYPELLELNAPLVATSFSVPDETLSQFASRSQG